MLDKLTSWENWDNFIISLEIMWKGMLAIFVVLIIITLIVVAMTKLQREKE